MILIIIVKNHSTWFGGLISIVAIVLVSGLIFISIIDITKTQNIIQTTSVVPIESLAATVYGNLEFKFFLYTFAGDCSQVKITTSGLTADLTQTWNTTTEFVNATCIITYACKNGTLTGSQQSIKMEMQNSPFVVASAVGYTISAPHYDSNKLHQISDYLEPSNATLAFRGTSATEFSLSFTTTQASRISGADFFFYNMISKVFNIQTMNTLNVGYAMTRNPTLVGSVTHGNNFWQTPAELQVLIKVISNPNAYSIQQLGKSTILDFFGKIAALIGAVLALCAAAMSFVEMAVITRMQKQKDRKIQQGMKTELEMTQTHVM